MGSNQYWGGVVYDMCVYYMTGAPEGSPKVVLWRSRESNLRPLVYNTYVYIPYTTAALGLKHMCLFVGQLSLHGSVITIV